MNRWICVNGPCSSGLNCMLWYFLSWTLEVNVGFAWDKTDDWSWEIKCEMCFINGSKKSHETRKAFVAVPSIGTSVVLFYINVTGIKKVSSKWAPALLLLKASHETMWMYLVYFRDYLLVTNPTPPPSLWPFPLQNFHRSQQEIWFIRRSCTSKETSSNAESHVLQNFGCWKDITPWVLDDKWMF